MQTCQRRRRGGEEKEQRREGGEEEQRREGEGGEEDEQRGRKPVLRLAPPGGCSRDVALRTKHLIKDHWTPALSTCTTSMPFNNINRINGDNTNPPSHGTTCSLHLPSLTLIPMCRLWMLPFVFPCSCGASVKLSVLLSANFSTCAKLKAVVWKKRLLLIPCVSAPIALIQASSAASGSERAF
uniref:Uncharacterized protein n=1 Tax=Knipowitschia caucasica TaxID=637954 RepID=A0AAV2KYW0_KNICA